MYGQPYLPVSSVKILSTYMYRKMSVISKFMRNYSLMRGKHFDALKAPTYLVTFLRHGESEWNKLNLFTGWYDAVLTSKGECEAEHAAAQFCRERMQFDAVFTSQLKRAIETANIIVGKQENRPEMVQEDWRLNERHYGNLTGMNKEAAVRLYGAKQVRLWRRSYEMVPPPIQPDHEYYFALKMASGRNFRTAESLKMTMERVVPYWQRVIVPKIRERRRVLVVAHNNTLRAIIKHIDGITDSDISACSFKTGAPFTYTFDMHMRPIRNKRLQFYGNLDEIEESREQLRRIL